MPPTTVSGVSVAVDMRYTKWGGKRHWWWSAEALGNDQFGWLVRQPGGDRAAPGQFEEPANTN